VLVAHSLRSSLHPLQIILNKTKKRLDIYIEL